MKTLNTVFSHIVQKRLSRENENVATEALAYILGYSTGARRGMMKLLRGIEPGLPEELRFQTQETEGKTRPDMWGYDYLKGDPRVYIENKFWAALTDNQPVNYLDHLAKYVQPTVLLVVVPEAREQTLQRELVRKLKGAGILFEKRDASAGIVFSVSTSRGPTLALTSWTRLISALEQALEQEKDEAAQNDLFQLRSLCDAADNDVPISAQDVSDQRTPALLLQLGTIVNDAMEKAFSAHSLYKGRFKPQADWKRIGRYATFSDEQGVGVWLGIHFGLWRLYGETPLWAVFSGTDWGRAREVRGKLEPWARENGVFTAFQDDKDDNFVVAIDIEFGEEKELVSNAIAERLKKIACVLSGLKRNQTAIPDNEGLDSVA
jgi:hypothetical protein